MKDKLESFNEFGLSLMFDEQTHSYTPERVVLPMELIHGILDMVLGK